MVPVLIDIGAIKIYTIGVFLILSLFWGMYLLWRNVKMTSFREEVIFDAFFISIVGGLVFSRLTFVVTNFSEFGISPLKFILINGYPGLSLWGLILGGIGTFMLYLHYRKLPAITIIDYAIPALFVALAVGKIGSFLGGVDVGVTTSLPLSVKYSGFEGSRHITAVYEAIIFLVGAFVAQRMLLATRRGVMGEGTVLLFFLWLYSLTEMLFDITKENHLYFLGQNINMIVSIIIWIGTTVYLLFIYHKQIGERLKKLKIRK